MFSRILRAAFAVVALVLAGPVLSQTPPGFVVVTASYGTGNTGGATTGLYQVDLLAGTAIPITGTAPETQGFLAGVQTINHGANCVQIDFATRVPPEAAKADPI